MIIYPSIVILCAGTRPCICYNGSDTISLVNVAENNSTSDATILTDTAAPDNEGEANALVEKGFLCYNAGDYACAWASFESAHAILPDDTDIFCYHGYLLSLQKH
jgi:tetratricopeptide (TPR) repeat protein